MRSKSSDIESQNTSNGEYFDNAYRVDLSDLSVKNDVTEVSV